MHSREIGAEGEEGFDAEAVYSNKNDVSCVRNFAVFRVDIFL